MIPFCKILTFGSEEHQQSIALRRKILRVPLGLNFTEEELQQEAEQMHIGCFTEIQLCGILILVKYNSTTVKMRQVAVDDTMQGKGIGRVMVVFAEQWAITNGYTLMSLHARETAVPFYLTLGYSIDGHQFEEVGIPHYKMIKKLI
ncbi:MAG: GNAT family N-acetyltransferase [Bacteroidota bacterium]